MRKLLFILLMLLASPVLAVDYYWTNAASSGDFTNANNWLPNGVPTINDNAFYTNRVGQSWNHLVDATNANTYINRTGGNITTTNNIGNNATWWITNSYAFTSVLTSTNTITHIAGTIAVTNAANTGVFDMGVLSRNFFNLNGGTLIANYLYSTNYDAGTRNIVPNSGTLTVLSGSDLTNAGTFSVGNTAGQTMTLNFLGGTNFISRVNAASWAMGTVAGATSIVNISGPATVFTNLAGRLLVGNSAGAHGRLTVSNNARVYFDRWTVGTTTASSNIVLVTGTNTIATQVGTAFTIGTSGWGNMMTLSNGAVMVSGSSAPSVGTTAGGSNMFIVTGVGTLISNANAVSVGSGSSSFNEFRVLNGGFVNNISITMGDTLGANSNLLVIAGSGSIMTNRTSGLGSIMGSVGSDNQCYITNGGAMYNVTSWRVGTNALSVRNYTLVSGENSLLQCGQVAFSGSNQSLFGTSTIDIQDGGTLEALTMISGFGDTGGITNRNGIFQFANLTPNFSNNNANIVCTNGTISFRNLGSVNISNNWIGSLTNIIFQADNRFRLNSATNAPSPYTFNTGLGSTNYIELQLVGTSPMWRSPNTFSTGAGGSLLISNARNAVISGVFSNGGLASFVSSSSTTWSNVVANNGHFTINTSTNTFLTNVFGSSTAYQTFGSSSIIRYDRSWSNGSQSATLGNMTNTSTVVLFTNLPGGTHTYNLTGSSAMERGSVVTNLAGVKTNLAIGNIKLAAGDLLMVTGVYNVNALYVGIIDVGNQSLANINNLKTGINVYYDTNFAENAYLLGATYDLDGDGVLTPMTMAAPGPGGNRSGDWFHLFQ